MSFEEWQKENTALLEPQGDGFAKWQAENARGQLPEDIQQIGRVSGRYPPVTPGMAAPSRSLSTAGIRGVPEPSMLGRAVEKGKEFFGVGQSRLPYAYDLPSGTKYLTPPLDRPAKIAVQLAAFYSAQVLSGLGLYIPDIIAGKVSSADSLAQIVNRVTGFRPTPREINAGEAAAFIGGLQTAGGIAGKLVNKIAARQALKTILHSGVTFAGRKGAKEIAEKFTTGAPLDIEGIHFEGGLGVLFGAGEVGIGRLLEWLKGFRKATGPGTVASSHAAARAEVDAALKIYKETGDSTAWDAVRAKYTGAPVPQRAAAAKPPEVKDFSKYPLAKPGKPPPTAPIPAPQPPRVARTPAQQGAITPEITPAAIQAPVPAAKPPLAPEAAPPVVEKVVRKGTSQRPVHIPPKDFVKTLREGITVEQPAPAKPTEAKEPWEITKEEFASDMQQHLKDILEQNKKAKTEGGLTYKSSTVARARRYVKYADQEHANRVREAVRYNRPVPREVLQEYRAEPWADEALAKMEGKEKPVAPAKPMKAVTGPVDMQSQPVVTEEGEPTELKFRKAANPTTIGPGFGESWIEVAGHPEIYTDGRILLKDRPKPEVQKWQERAKQKDIKASGHENPRLSLTMESVQQVLDSNKNPKPLPEPIGIQVGHYQPVAIFDVGEETVRAMNAKAFEWLRRNGYEIYYDGSESRSPWVLRRKGKIAGVVMPANAGDTKADVFKPKGQRKLPKKGRKARPGLVRIPRPYAPKPKPGRHLPAEVKERVLPSIIKAVKAAKKVRPEVQVEQRKERRRRVAAAARSLEKQRGKGVSAQMAIPRSTGLLKGPLTEYGHAYESIRNGIPEADLTAAYNSISDSPGLRYFEKITTKEAFDKLLDGDYLTRGDLRLLERHFGAGIVKAARARVPLGEKLLDLFLELANLPRTLMASGDMSGILRQARPLAQAHPKEGAKFIAHYHRAFFSEQNAAQLDDIVRSDPLYDEARIIGLELPELAEYGAYGPAPEEREERYQAAAMAETIPYIGRIVRASERSFVAALNWHRMAVYSKIRMAAKQQGKSMSEADMRELAGAINDLSGRSSVGRHRGFLKFTSFLNAIFFSPRFSISRIKPLGTIPKGAYRSAKAGRVTPGTKLTVTALASLIGTNLLIMALAKLAGGDDVEIEPDLRAADGGKIKHKNTRFDLWAGYLQPARLMVRLATGEIKTQLGRTMKIPRRQMLKSFLRSKFSPPASLNSDVLAEERYYGQKFGAPPGGKTGEKLDKWGVPLWLQGAGKEVWNRLAFLSAQDTADALLDNGVPMSVLAGTLAFYGSGVQTYEPSPGTTVLLEKKRLAQERYKREWDDLKPSEQAVINKMPEIRQAEEKKKRQQARLGPPTQYRVSEDLYASQKAIYSALPEAVQKEYDSLALLPGGISRRIGQDFYLSDARFNRYRQFVAELMNRRIPAIVADSRYQRLEYTEKVKVLKDEEEKLRAEARKMLLHEIESNKERKD